MTRLLLILVAAVLAVIASVGGVSADGPEEEWNKTFGGTNDDCAYSVRQTSDGNYIFAGYTYNDF